MKRDIETELNSRERHNVHTQLSSAFLKNKVHYERNEKKVQLMGILNCTPDSFYDGGNFFTVEKAIAHGLKIADDGADIIDIGGESTRPNSETVEEAEELKRVLPVISVLSSQLSIPLSIDTYKYTVAQKALEMGATFINDVTGFSDPSMQKLAADAKVSICIMHMQKTPKDMQQSPAYPRGVVIELLEWFEKRIDVLLKSGVKPSQMILDPGIGFGKTVSQNQEILKNIVKFKALGFPVLIGLSRKSFMSKILGKPVRDLLSTTLALNTMSILEGADFIRVHDVKEHRDVITILESFQK